MRRFVLGWKMLGLEQTLGARLVTYADDLVILCRRGKAEAALQRLREIMGKLKLTVNEDKTRICTVPGEEFELGEDRRGPYRLPAVKEKHSARCRESPRADRPSGIMARDHDAGE